MKPLHIAICGLTALSLVLSAGCKKDEPESSSAPEPEKVSEATTAKKSGALEGDKDEAPTDRKLKTRTSKGSAAAKPKGKAASKPKTSSKAKTPSKAQPKPLKPTGKAATKPSTAKAKPAAGPMLAKAKAQPAAKPGGAPPARPSMRPGKRPAKPKRNDAPTDAYDEEPPMDVSADPLDPNIAPAPPAAGPRATKPAPPRGPRARRPMRRNGRGGPAAIEADDEPDDEPPAEAPSGRFRNDRRKNPVPRANDPRAMDKRGPGTRPAGLPTRVRPNAEQLLRKDDLTTVLGLKKTVDVHELSGIASDHEYDGIYWGSPDGKEYYVGIQLWKMRSPIEAQRQYTQMVRSYPNAEETTAITSKTFLAFWNEFIYLVYLDTTKQSVVAVTCHEKVCTEPQKLVTIAQTAKERL